MLGTALIAFVRASLPAPPARVLEIGAGDGELTAALAAAGYDVLAIDPGSDSDAVRPVALHELDEPAASFDAAVAIVSLHHVQPLEESFRRLAELVRGGGTLVIDEIDFERFDERAARWWLEQRDDHAHTAEMMAGAREHMHPLARLRRGARAVVRARRAGPRAVPVPLGHAGRHARAGGAADRRRRAARHGRAARRNQKTLSVRLRVMPPTWTVTRYLPRPRGRTNVL